MSAPITDYKWVIETILPAEEFSLIGGPSGSGKSTWLLQTIKEWQAGRPIFGHKSYPAPFAYVSCDRSKAGVERTFARVGIEVEKFPYLPALDGGFDSMGSIIEYVLKAVPGCKVVFVEGIAMFAPCGREADYKRVAKWITDITRTCQQKHITIIGIVHSPKTKEKEGYANPRQRVLGSVAWAAYTETIILVEPKPEQAGKVSEIRHLYILPRNAPEETFEMELDGSGLLVSTQAVQTAHFLMNRWLQDTVKPGDDFPHADALEAGSRKNVSRAAVYRWLRQSVSDGVLTRLDKGLYHHNRKA